MENDFRTEEGLYPPLPKSKEHTFLRKVAFYFLVFFVLVGFFYLFLFRAPTMPGDEISVSIEEGQSLRGVSKILEENKVIRSRALFEAFVILYGGEKHILPGDYKFSSSSSVLKIAQTISGGDRSLILTKVTIPEGFDTKDIAETFAKKLQNFNEEKFLLEAEKKEGYLFPDTYLFFSQDNEEDVIKAMSDNFEKKTRPLQDEVESSGKTLDEIIIMASIIEREAKGAEDREFISGILWRRIEINMPLQADAAPETYKNRGLPERPIANPGILSIKASIYPKKSPYLYYLHDQEGAIHFAKTFEEHRQNKIKYLK